MDMNLNNFIMHSLNDRARVNCRHSLLQSTDNIKKQMKKEHLDGV